MSSEGVMSPRVADVLPRWFDHGVRGGDGWEVDEDGKLGAWDPRREEAAELVGGATSVVRRHDEPEADDAREDGREVNGYMRGEQWMCGSAAESVAWARSPPSGRWRTKA